jgi:hypothetical protein
VRGRFPALLLAGAALAAALPSAPRARADEPAHEAEATPVIAVLCAPGDPFGLRVQAELESLGFRTVLFDPAAEPASRGSLEAWARKAGAIAAIRAVASEDGVEVWIADRVTGKTVLREMARDGAALDRDASLALRVVDLLRASLLEVALPGRPPGEVSATPELREKLHLPEPDAERPAPALPVRSLRFSLAPGVMLSPGGFGPAGSLQVGVAWTPKERVGLSGFAALPLSRPRVSGPPGSADLSVVLAGGAVRFLFLPRSDRWEPSAEVGLMAVALESTSTVHGGFVPGSSSTGTAAAFARVGLACALTPTLRLRADVLAGLIGQGVLVQLATEQVATWGLPVVLSSAGVDFGWL